MQLLRRELREWILKRQRKDAVGIQVAALGLFAQCAIKRN